MQATSFFLTNDIVMYIFEIQDFPIFYVIYLGSTSSRMGILKKRCEHFYDSKYISLNCFAAELDHCTVPPVIHKKAMQGIFPCMEPSFTLSTIITCNIYFSNLTGKNSSILSNLLFFDYQQSFCILPYVSLLVVFAVQFLTFY